MIMDVQARFKDALRKDQNASAAIVAIKTLLELIKTGSATTILELDKNLNSAVDTLKKCDVSVTSITSGCELFRRFIVNIESEGRDRTFEECKTLLLERGNRFVQKVELSRQKIAKLGNSHIKENAVILVHSKSRVVLELLMTAKKSGKHFQVYVTQSLPDSAGHQMVSALEEEDIPCTCILDGAIGYIMEKVDIVLIGAEGVLASGGIINKIGTYTMALAAKAHNKPVYVIAESFKFSPLYPLNQQDVPNSYKYTFSTMKNSSSEELEKEHPLVDYTPPEYLTLLFTDIGILTPTAVSDELIKLSIT